MKKVAVFALVLMSLMPLVASQVFAADESTQAGILEAGNKLCPVMGGPVNGENFVVYEGKRYGLCCPGCEKMFLSHPAKYIAQMEKQESGEMESAMEQGDL